MNVLPNQDILFRMSATSRPTLREKLGGKGKSSIVFERFNGSEYIVYDSSQNSPRGFGVRVDKTSRRYIVQQKVDKKIPKLVVASCGDQTRPMCPTSRTFALVLARLYLAAAMDLFSHQAPFASYGFICSKSRKGNCWEPG